MVLTIMWYLLPFTLIPECGNFRVVVWVSHLLYTVNCTFSGRPRLCCPLPILFVLHPLYTLNCIFSGRPRLRRPLCYPWPSECHTYFTLWIVHFQRGPGCVYPDPLSATPTLLCVSYIFREDPVTPTPTAASDVLPAREHDVLAADEYVAPAHVARGEAAQVKCIVIGEQFHNAYAFLRLVTVQIFTMQPYSYHRQFRDKSPNPL